mmetsp:Transcript_12472/g.12889  ORF Transcript_12472/g.12889 Transcript_12472/m.12889 type:complete len:313 (-) Transcript_12472:124-1062(-)
MDGFTPKVAGAQANETPESILEEELERLKHEKNRLKDENSNYIKKHPELQPLLDEFLTEILIKKPHDIVRFGQQFFSEKAKNTQEKIHPNGPLPLVIAGPSGVGKGTLINLLFEKYPSFFGFSVSHTTRGPRPGEQNGVHYNFVSIDEMKAAIEQGKFIEHAQVHTNFYGTSFEAVEKIQSQGKICVLDIDIQGVQNVKRSGLDCKYIFIAPPNMQTLESRLRGRGTETEDKIAVRLKNAKVELEYGLEEGNFDAVVVNSTIDEAFIRLLSFIEEFYSSYGFHIQVEDLQDKKKSTKQKGGDDDEEEEEDDT